MIFVALFLFLFGIISFVVFGFSCLFMVRPLLSNSRSKTRREVMAMLSPRQRLIHNLSLHSFLGVFVLLVILQYFLP